MDVYGLSAPDFFRIDDLLDFSNDDLFSTTADSDLHHQHHFSLPENTTAAASAAHCHAPNPIQSTDFTDDLCVPNDDIAELEWLSNFVDDSFTDFPKNDLAGTASFRPDTSSNGRSRSKRSRAASATKSWTSSPECETPTVGKPKTNTNSNNTKKKESSSSSSALTGDRSSSSSTSQSVARRCMHCESEKTPQWRTGPLGPKTLCNACGVRYKSGRLVPEYRPAASPTFMLTQHSNSHRKVMELRRQKELLLQQQQEQFYHRDFEVC